MFGGERVEGVGVFAVVLDKDEVPNLDDGGIVGIDEIGGIAASKPVVVDLSARSARPFCPVSPPLLPD